MEEATRTNAPVKGVENTAVDGVYSGIGSWM